MKLGIVFGGVSTEHDVSVVSGTSILKNINKDKYNIYPIYINESGEWYEFLEDINTLEIYKIGMHPTNIKKIDNIVTYLKNLDIILPVLHGKNGEDGTIQGLFEILNIPYIGCGVLSSSVCMDKVYTKLLFNQANIKNAKFIYLKRINNEIYIIDELFNKEIFNINKLDELIKDKLNYPVFIKPSNSGSSVGVSKVSSFNELEDSINNAFLYDDKVLIEETIIGREIECAILNGKAYGIGEVKSAENYYTFDAKYNNNESKTIIPAIIDKEVENNIKDIAEKAFLLVDGNNISRVDFFIEDNTNEIYLNEINTLPGFTEISMYPKLINSYNISYEELIDLLINDAWNNKKQICIND